MGLSAISLFAGAGGLDLAARWAGIRTACYVEWDVRAQATLINRIRGGYLDDAPIWDDVTTFDASAWRGAVDIVFGGFPCQPHSTAGKRLGEDDERNLWPDTLRILVESGAWGFIGENVTGIVRNGYLFTVLADLEREGFKATPFRVTSCAVGGSHTRTRVFIVAHDPSKRRGGMEEIAAGLSPRVDIESLVSRRRARPAPFHLPSPMDIAWHSPTVGVRRVDDGLAEGMDRIKLCGNGVDPYAALPAFQKLIAGGR